MLPDHLGTGSDPLRLPSLSKRSCKAEASQTTITAGAEKTQHNKKRVARTVNIERSQPYLAVITPDSGVSSIWKPRYPGYMALPPLIEF
jgi:hypothetical protein